MLLVIVTTFTPAMGLARELKHKGIVLEQVLVTPIRPLLLLVGKMAPFVVIGLVDVTLLDWRRVPGSSTSPSAGASASLLYLGDGALPLSPPPSAALSSHHVPPSQQQGLPGGFMFTLPAVLLSGLDDALSLAIPGWLLPCSRS